MTSQSTTNWTATAPELDQFTRRVFQQLGVPLDQATDAAAALVWADARGIDTHGIRNLKRYYVDGIQRGEIQPAAEFVIEHQTPVSMRVDGGLGLGMAAGCWSMRQAIQMARQSGIGMVAVNRSHHYGAAGCYAAMALSEDMVGVSLTGCLWSTGRERACVPMFGSLGILSTNPISMAFPGDQEPPMIVDLATSVVPVNRVEMFESLGQAIPTGWAVNRAGEAVTDPSEFYAVRPLGGERQQGGHKGTSLALMVEALTGVLSGAWRMHELAELPAGDIEAPAEPRYDQPYVAHFLAAIRVDLFQPLQQFKAAMDAMVRTVRDSPTATGHDRVIYPGLLEQECLLEREREGIPLPAVVADELRELAQQMDLPLQLQELTGGCADSEGE